MGHTVKKLPMSLKIKFGIADFGLAGMSASIQFYMLFYYTDVVKIDPALAGTAILVGKLTWDMINDVLAGYISDRTKSRWGRRRPYLIFCALPLFLSFWLLYSLPVGLKGAAAFFAIMGTFWLFDTFHTMISTAYYSMTAELTTDYDDRTSLATTGMIFSVVGYICGAAITMLLAGILQSSFGMTVRQAWSSVGFTFGFVAMIAVLITGFLVRAKPMVSEAPTRMPPIRAFLSTLKNKPFVKFLTVSMIMSTAFTVVTTMLAYYINYQLKMGAMQSIIMLLLLVTIAVFLVPCKAVTNRLGKGKTYALGLAIAGAALLCGFFLPSKPTALVYVISVTAGIGFSSQWVCPNSMMPDVIEYDQLATGERREGIFYGTWSVARKVPSALGSAICGWGLKLFGYVEGAQQTETALLGIRLMFAILPAVLLFICVPLLIKYPITRENHAALLEELNRRDGGEAAQ